MYHPVAHPDDVLPQYLVILGSQLQRESTGSFPDILQPPCQRCLGDLVRSTFLPAGRDVLRYQARFINDVERETGKIEQPGFRAGVDQQIEVTAVIGIAPATDPKTRMLLTP